jgi:carotenoid 1,2-hydratase
MTERGRRHVARDARQFRIGPSALRWNGQSLEIDVDERATPLPHRVRGRITVHPLGLTRFRADLDAAGRHRWGPIAPCARLEVALDAPALRWAGHGYLDSNEGDEPIERAFDRWDWLRAPLPDGRCAVVYDARDHAGRERLIAARFDAQGHAEPIALPPRQALPPTRWWRIAREARTEATGTAAPTVQRTLEDTPFYARSLLGLHLDGHPVEAMHETLDLPRLTHPVVQRLLPWRMPRRA